MLHKNQLLNKTRIYSANTEAHFIHTPAVNESNALQNESNVGANTEIIKIMDQSFFLKLEKNQFTVLSRLSGSCFGAFDRVMHDNTPPIWTSLQICTGVLRNFGQTFTFTPSCNCANLLLCKTTTVFKHKFNEFQANP